MEPLMLEASPLVEPLAPTRCDREPIHAPGSVQAHGALLVFHPLDGMRVVYRSENLATVLELGPESLGGSVVALVGDASLDAIMRAADRSPTDSVPIPLVLASGMAMDATVHRNDGMVVVELERPGPADERSSVLHRVRRAVQQIDAAATPAEACDVTVAEVQVITGYDRVMIYRFHEDEHGEVVAEARRGDMQSYVGLHYPATDIPRPARRLLRLSPTRLIADVDGVPVPIEGHGPFASRSLDLSRAALRTVSPIHLQYLRNMGVGASLTFSLSDGPRLWGLLALHHREPRLPTVEVRSACLVIAHALWLRIDALESRTRLAAEERRLSLRARFLATLSSVVPLAQALADDGHSLLELVDADGVSIRIDGVTSTLGATPSRDEIRRLVERLGRSFDLSPVVSDGASISFPGVGLPPRSAAGVLAVPLSPTWDEHLIWFRGEAERTSTWAGDPSKARYLDAREPLTPRSSFEAWHETMRGRSRAWSASDVSSACTLGSDVPDVQAARSRDALAKQALRDSLTGLPNRALLLDRLEVALSDTGRLGHDIWILFVDLDGFKAVNDGLGHEAGDQLLVETASRLRRSVRAADTVARLGGDEFVVVCTAEAQLETVERMAATVLEALSAPLQIDGQRCEITASVGLVAVDSRWTPAAALRAADSAMYRAKREGRNRLSR